MKLDADSKFEDKMFKILLFQSVIVIINLAFGWWLSCIVTMLSMFFVPILLLRKDLHNIYEELREANIIANEANLDRIKKQYDEMFSYNKEMPK